MQLVVIAHRGIRLVGRLDFAPGDVVHLQELVMPFIQSVTKHSGASPTQSVTHLAGARQADETCWQ